jgi:predicted RNase H-like HicB family nuclease
MKKDNIADKFTYCVVWSQDDNAHIAYCLEFPSIAAHGDTASKALIEIEKAVKASIKWMQEDGEYIPQPLKITKSEGQVTFQIPEVNYEEMFSRVI